MARSRKRRRGGRWPPPSRILLRWLGVAAVIFMAFLYSQPVRSYLSTRNALAQRTQDVRSLRAEKQLLERKLAVADMPAALTREARRIGYVKAGEHLFIIKGIAAWRRAHEPGSP